MYVPILPGCCNREGREGEKGEKEGEQRDGMGRLVYPMADFVDRLKFFAVHK